MRLLLTPTAALALLAVPAQAQYLRQPQPDIVDNSIGSTDPQSLPPQQSRAMPMPMDGEVRNIGTGQIVSGGVTGDERDALNAEQRGKSVKLVFAATNGEYLSDVQLTVRNGKGAIVATLDRSEGPFVFIALPAGSYTVTANLNGETRTQKIIAGKGQKSYTIRFRPQ